MSVIKTFMSSKNGIIILSIIWGLGLATIFRKVCDGRNCIIIKGPRPDHVNGKIYSFNNKCYKYNAINTSCKVQK